MSPKEIMKILISKKDSNNEVVLSEILADTKIDEVALHELIPIWTSMGIARQTDLDHITILEGFDRIFNSL